MQNMVFCCKLLPRMKLTDCHELSSDGQFKDRLQRALDASELDGNQSALARCVDKKPQTVQKWLAGDHIPGPDVIEKVAEALGMGVSASWLLYGDVQAPLLPPTPEYEKYLLAYITQDEAKLLTRYRESTETGKQQMQVSGDFAAKLPAAELPTKAAS